METYYWKTTECLGTNTDNMNDFLDNHLLEHCGETYMITHEDGTYAEIQNDNGVLYGLHASGNGDSFNHKIEFELIS